MLFEEYPIILFVIVIIVVEAWLRVREPLFRVIARLFGKGTAP